ncbi:D-2-hydroxyglutarate dehydrogenase, mitochondrial [Pseudolycoriella hygida]|uniref:D-2-hydroxyglutarate dehydrogenase, mitochondrial n=1 Tax=Pseudolycoriella hygida TaxID=35572 RepID=A0A9Q0MUA6_9DIPT|nr:D-2-hydroxyglutarate dehydrogenase, mitochondrial [Pseudolycoriella hygida]
MLSSIKLRPCLWKQSQILKRSYAWATLPDFTKDRYQVTRGDFSQVTDADIGQFQSILKNSRVLLDDNDTQAYNIDTMKSVRGYSRVVLKPKTTEEVSKILSYCNDRKLAVCPQGGNTGLVGGSVPVFDEVIVSTQLMNRIENIDELSGTLECQSGCILEVLEQAVSEKGLCEHKILFKKNDSNESSLGMPLDLGAKGSCHIGGNLSTNAGGIRLLRYGNLHGSVLGLEAVKADGTILDLMSNFKKDNTGYHLKHLFIGSEGTLGLITKVSISCPTASRAINVAFLGLESYDAVLQTFLAAKRDLGEILSSCEMLDKDALDCSLNAYNLRSPISKYPFYMLIETSGSRMDHDEEKINKFLQYVMEKKLVVDGTVTNEPGKMKAIWEPRETIGTAMFKDCYSFSYDFSVPLKNFYDLVNATKKQISDLPANAFGFGHLGDSNLHLIVQCKEYDSEIHRRVEPFVYEFTSKLKGSISSEHGIGFLKSKYLQFSKKSECIDAMKEIKTFMDPNGILNPYKVLPKNVC